MRRSEGPIRLRRDVRGFLAGYTLESIYVVLAAALVWAWTGDRVEREHPVAMGLMLALFLVPVLWSYVLSRVVLEADRLRAGHRFARHPPFGLRVPRSEVAGARPGKVVFARGTMVSGIEVELVDGTTAELPMSALLGERRSSQWISAINEWASENRP